MGKVSSVGFQFLNSLIPQFVNPLILSDKKGKVFPLCGKLLEKKEKRFPPQ
jgi:hypothetical protein